MYNFKKYVLNRNQYGRLLVVSDVHGHYNHLISVLQKAGFSDGDLLIVIGDIVDKGPESLKTLRYLMRLYNEGRAIATIGNVDYRCLYYIYGLNDKKIDPEKFLERMEWLRSWKGTSLFDEMFLEIGELPQDETTLYKTLPSLLEHFSAELEFLRSLPTIIESDNYLFVHGGLPLENIDNNENINAFDFLKVDHFLSNCSNNKKRFKKHIVCGHWPVQNYGINTLCGNPIFDKTTNIISIDGGCGLLREGQLNLMILPCIDCEPDKIDCINVDFLPTATALERQVCSSESFSIGWNDNDVRFLELKEDMALIEQVCSKKRMWVTADSLWDDYNKLSNGDITKINQSTDYCLDIHPNDVISVVKMTSKGILAKKDGTIGWYHGKIQ